MERSLIETYILYRSNPDNDDKADSLFISSFGFSLKDLRKAKRQNKDWASKVLDARRKLYAEHILGVDKALFQAAKAGDTKAADLLYRRFDNWNPRIVEQTNNYYNFADIVKELKSPKHVRHVKKDL
jgi:hypothetical protein